MNVVGSFVVAGTFFYRFLGTVFLTARVLLWASLIVAAWYAIVENDNEAVLASKRKKRRASRSAPLTETALQQHNQEEALASAQTPTPARQYPKFAGDHPFEGISEMGSDESVDEWSLWQLQQDQQALETPPTRVETPLPPTAGATVQPTDADEAQALAATTLGGNIDFIKEPAKKVIRHGKFPGEKHVVKKPFLPRKIEKYFVAPYAAKYERLGYFVYKSFNKVGTKIESSVDILAKDLDASIREAGVQAVVHVELVMRKYLKFFGVVALLTVVLLPLPSVHITLGVAS